LPTQAETEAGVEVAAAVADGGEGSEMEVEVEPDVEPAQLMKAIKYGDERTALQYLAGRLLQPLI
jgi:hypothetical protein